MDKKIILAVDDDVTQLKLYQGMLVPKYDLRVVKSSSDAMRYLNTNLADVILLDIEMPNVSGFEFLGDIRKIPSYSTVPVIIISGNTGQDFYKQAKKSSAADVLIKPVQADMLVEAIEKIPAD